MVKQWEGFSETNMSISVRHIKTFVWFLTRLAFVLPSAPCLCPLFPCTCIRCSTMTAVVFSHVNPGRKEKPGHPNSGAQEDLQHSSITQLSQPDILSLHLFLSFFTNRCFRIHHIIPMIDWWHPLALSYRTTSTKAPPDRYLRRRVPKASNVPKPVKFVLESYFDILL